ncbi:tol-pal system protein YbgF [Roseivivax sp. CAU 1761]
MVRQSVLALVLSAAVALPAAGQDAASLADIRQDLSTLSAELQSLRRELDASGASGVTIAGSTLDRVNAIEAELQRLTSRTEEMQFRIERVVQDGTNRIGDLEFRLCEVEPGCDFGALGTPAPLGQGDTATRPAPAAPTAPGAAAPAAPASPGAPSGVTRPQLRGGAGTGSGDAAAPEPGGAASEAPAIAAATGNQPADGGAAAPAEMPAPSSGTLIPPQPGAEAGSELPLADPSVQLAAAEEADYRRAREALDRGDFQQAADLFSGFRQTYPGGPLDAAALLGEGRALEGLGQPKEAARAYLDVYSGHPDAPVAPEALWRLGEKLGELGSTREACVTLSEVSKRYPGTAAVDRAQEALGRLTCP